MLSQPATYIVHDTMTNLATILALWVTLAGIAAAFHATVKHTKK